MIKISLYENAFESISHGIEHLYLAVNSGEGKDYKHALLNIFQGTELLLKHLLYLKNPIFAFDKNSLYEKCADLMNPTLSELFECKSLEINKLCSEVKKHYFDFPTLKIVENAARQRNKIQHFGIQIEANEIKGLILGLYYQVISPALKIIGKSIEDKKYDDVLYGELNNIFSFFAVADNEQKFITVNGEDFTRTHCHYCGNYSLFIFYDTQSYPTRYYCSSCNNKKDNINIEEFRDCPECGACSIVYDESIDAGICLWYKCANNKDGGITLDMEYCNSCNDYKIEGKCQCKIEEGN